MTKLSLILKLIAKIIGGLSIAYGFIVGVLGSGPDGSHEPLLIRIVGIYIILLGAMYFYPNSKLSGNRTKTIGYLFLTASPLLIVIFFTLYTIVTEGLRSFIIQDGHIIVPVLVTLSLFAPVSLLASKSEKPYNKTDARAQEKLAAFIVKGIWASKAVLPAGEPQTL